MSFALPDSGDGSRPLREHAVHFYEAPSNLAAVVTDHVAQGIAEGDGALLVATPENLEPIQASMRGRGLDVARLKDSGRYVALDAERTLARFMRDGRPDPGRFDETITEALAAVTGTSHVVFGEMVALLWRQGRREAALALERLWTRFARRRSLSLLCAYPMQAFGEAQDATALTDVCLVHSRIARERATGAQDPTEADGVVVTQLRQRTLALDREVERRKEAEEALRRREAELLEVLDGVADSVLDLDPDGRIRFANRAHLELLGYARNEFVGMNLDEFLEAGDLLRVAWAGLLRGEPLRDVRTALRRRDGSMQPLRITGAVLRVADRAAQMRWFLAVGR